MLAGDLHTPLPSPWDASAQPCDNMPPIFKEGDLDWDESMRVW